MEAVAERTASVNCPDAYRTATGLLVRPDGIIAWATDTTDHDEAAADLTAALSRWAGESARYALTAVAL